MTAKDFLRQVFEAYSETDSKLEQIERLKSLSERTTTVISGAPGGRGSSLTSRIESALLRLDGQIDLLADDINRLTEVRREVSEAIGKVADPTQRRVLEYRYLSFLTWREISHVMKAGLRTIYRLHKSALKNFRFGSQWH